MEERDIKKIKNLEKAGERIKKAIKDKENIVLFGDSDLDGVTSVIIAKETIQNLGGRVSAVAFPDRDNDGYGLNKKAISQIKKFGPALLIVFDCGIGNFEEIKIANKNGFEVIVVDHHEILGKLPEASIIIDPKQPGDEYPFKNLAAVGLSLYLSSFILGEKMTESLSQNFLELAAMATIADMMPRIEDNEEIIRKGLSSIRDSWRPGIKALFKIVSLEFDSPDVFLEKESQVKGFNYLSPIQQVEKINSFLNIPEIENGLPVIFQLLTTPNEEKAEKIVQNLLKKTLEKKEKIREIILFLEEKMTENPFQKIIFEGNKDWRLILLGVPASIISSKYQIPVFLFRKGEKDSPGSARAPLGENLVKMMEKCSEYLITYGGHPPAAGFRVKNENLGKFKDCLEKHIH